MSVQISLLRSENTSLRAEQEDIRSKLTVVLAEKEVLEKKVSSVFELKQAIKELKKKMRSVRIVQSPVMKEPLITTAFKPEQAIEGNRGFVIKGGKLTYPTKVKIEVTDTSH